VPLLVPLFEKKWHQKENTGKQKQIKANKPLVNKDIERKEQTKRKHRLAC